MTNRMARPVAGYTRQPPVVAFGAGCVAALAHFLVLSESPIGESVSIVSHLWRPFTHPAVASGPWFVPVTLREGQEGCGGSTWNPPPSRRSRARLSRWASFLPRCVAAADPPGCTCQVRALQEPAGSALSRPLGTGRFLRLFKAV